MPAGPRGAPSSGRQCGPQCLAGLCSLGRGKPGEQGEGAGSQQPATFCSGQAVSTQRALPWGSWAWEQTGMSPFLVLLNPQMTCEVGMEQSSVQLPPLWPFLCHGPVAQSMVLVKMRKYLYKNNLKNMVCQIIKAAEHPRSFQLDWEIRCCFPTPHCDAGGAHGRPWPGGLLDLHVWVRGRFEIFINVVWGPQRWAAFTCINSSHPLPGTPAGDGISPGTGFSLMSWFRHRPPHWDSARRQRSPWVKRCIAVPPRAAWRGWGLAWAVGGWPPVLRGGRGTASPSPPEPAAFQKFGFAVVGREPWVRVSPQGMRFVSI